MPWSTDDIPELTGRVAVVTGANGGLGLETAKELARKGARVLMAVRDQAKAGRAVDEIRKEVPAATLELIPLDLGSLDSVRRAAAAISGSAPRLDLLFCNAGIMAVPEQRSADGQELQLAVNHFGHFALTGLLLPNLLRAPAARIVTTTSIARHIGRPVDPDDLLLEGHYDPWRAYGRSKLANAHFANELHRRLWSARARAASLLAHPGVSATDLQERSVMGRDERLARVMKGATALTSQSAADGALPQLRAGTDPSAGGGQMYVPLLEMWGPPVRRPQRPRDISSTHGAALWALSQEVTGVEVDVSAMAVAAD